jgi:hypothetical protein
MNNSTEGYSDCHNTPVDPREFVAPSYQVAVTERIRDLAAVDVVPIGDNAQSQGQRTPTASSGAMGE